MKTIFVFVVAAVLVLGVVGCQSGVTASQVATDISNLATGLDAALTQVGSSGVLSPSTVSQIQADLVLVKGISTKASALTAGQSLATADAKTLVLAVNDIVALTTQPPASALIPPPIEDGFIAASVLLPVVESELGLSGVAAASAAPAMSAVKARATLAGLAAH